MGVSTDGLLWYGVDLGNDEDEFNEKIRRIIYGPDEEDDDYDDGNNELYGDGREWMTEHGLTGVEFVTHCSNDYEMFGLAVAGTLTTARRGYPVSIDALPTPDDTNLRAALEVLGLEPGRVGWLLASYWG